MDAIFDPFDDYQLGDSDQRYKLAVVNNESVQDASKYHYQTNDYEHAYLSRLTSGSVCLAHILRIGASIGEQMGELDLDGLAVPPYGWASVLDKLLLGLTHTISNRVATLTSVSDILSDDPTIPPILRALADEVPRLEEALRLLRLLVTPEDERDEALEATRVADDAISLAQLHPACQNLRFDVERRREVPPVIARPTALTHELVVALTAAASELDKFPAVAGQANGMARIPIVFSQDERDLVISVGSAVVRARLLAEGRD